MEYGNRKLAVAFGALLSVGMAGQASADVYGLSYLNIDNMRLSFNTSDAGAGLYTFSSNQDAVLNDVADLTAGNASCSGNFGVGTTCSLPDPTLSGKVQNAPPGSAGVRSEGSYTKFGIAGDYSNAEAGIISAQLTGDPATHATAISESNLHTGTGAQAYAELASNTSLMLAFAVGPSGILSVSFDAEIDLHTEVTDGDFGIAQANSTVRLVLQKRG